MAAPSILWSVDLLGVGSIDSNGLYTSGIIRGSATVRATNGAVTATASVTVTDAPPSILLPASATPNPIRGTTTAVSVLASDIGGTGNLIYTWVATVKPSRATPKFSANGTALSNATTVSFDDAGDYTFSVTVSDGIGVNELITNTATLHLK